MALESSTQLSLVPCRKRSRIEKEDPYDLFNIDELPDDLLCEILKRLPSSQWVLQCKSVSKRWYSLISDPCFIRSFIHHRHCHQFSEQQFNFLSHYSRDECVVLPSNTSELCSRKISVNSLLCLHLLVLFACNGMLHWVDTNSNGIVVFDPFNDVEQCHYIDPPIGLWATAKISLGLFQGRLRIFHNCDEEFYVWELKDNYGTWCMKHKVNLKKIVSQNSRLVEITKAYSPRVNFVAFHPNDGELVFLQFLDDIVLCNMRTRVLNIARTIPNSHMCSSLLLLQPSWPTPVAPLPLKFECPP
uniref:F-box domain-containing protein n=1 Tax=Fagus sylvatica TaxID=28930 RepID=A0A2N9J502_FAGSY